ncbi:hypothetical protein OMW55_01410 [Sphingomonas sp. BN140010]|uniref:DUF3108 domain-containing protein n=1 Tax=Sphingomonas arvum TaxID=2992113 RepID=A0ABT3JBM5_9SPHN|nr:hypothetical protein [Sphingomonas sp. BN140010]MCW3796468.1 hypothetical protein [Sphingomonas sp. BN140010]
MPILLAFLLVSAPPPAAAALVGEWRTDQMEMAGGLELRANGHFRYALSYGAADETGAGKWELRSDRVILTSDPMPVAPAFELVSDQRLPKGELRVELEPPGFGYQGSYDVLLYSTGKAAPEVAKAMSDGLVSLGERPYPDRVVPAVPFYPVEPQGAVRLDARFGHRLVFRFKPNDLGKAAFKGEPLILDGDRLLLVRFDTAIRFRKVDP